MKSTDFHAIAGVFPEFVDKGVRVMFRVADNENIAFTELKRDLSKLSERERTALLAFALLQIGQRAILANARLYGACEWNKN